MLVGIFFIPASSRFLLHEGRTLEPSTSGNAYAEQSSNMERFARRFKAYAILPGFFLALLIVRCSYLTNTNTNTNVGAAEGTYITGLII